MDDLAPIPVDKAKTGKSQKATQEDLARERARQREFREYCKRYTAACAALPEHPYQGRKA